MRIEIQPWQTYVQDFRKTMEAARAADGSPLDVLKDFPDSVLIGAEGNELRADLKYNTCSIQKDGKVEQGGKYRRTTEYHQVDNDHLKVRDIIASNISFGGATAMTEYSLLIDTKNGTLTLLDTEVFLK